MERFELHYDDLTLEGGIFPLPLLSGFDQLQPGDRFGFLEGGIFPLPLLSDVACGRALRMRSHLKGEYSPFLC